MTSIAYKYLSTVENVNGISIDWSTMRICVSNLAFENPMSFNDQTAFVNLCFLETVHEWMFLPLDFVENIGLSTLLSCPFTPQFVFTTAIFLEGSSFHAWRLVVRAVSGAVD